MDNKKSVLKPPIKQSKFGKPLGFRAPNLGNLNQNVKASSAKGIFNPSTFKQTQHKG